MKLRFLPFALLLAVPAFAGNSTIEFSTAQSNTIQNRLIPDYNAKHCLQFNLAPNCTTANLVSAGCVVRSFGPPAVAIILDSCVIFAQNATGEDAYLQEILHQKLVDSFNQRTSSDEAVRDAAYSNANQTQKDAVCTAMGISTTFCQ